MIGIDYDSFMIVSCIGAHYLKNNTEDGSTWDSVWESTRSKKIDKHFNSKKLTIFAVSNIIDLPRETVRRKVEILRKNKLISYSFKDGLLPTDRVEDAIKPYATKELNSLAKFIQALRKHKSLDQILSL